MSIGRILIRSKADIFDKENTQIEERLGTVFSLADNQNETTNLYFGESPNDGFWCVRAPLVKVQAAFQNAQNLNVILIGEQELISDPQNGSRYFLKLGELAR